ncbi:MAG: isoprenylcysteine carboxylmethyltransferase family protein [Candidatus Berkiella sp.]
MNTPTLPPSATQLWWGLLALGLSIIAFSLCLNLGFAPLTIIFACGLSYSLPLLLAEGLKHQKKQAEKRNPFSISDLITKLLGLYATLGFVLFCYWLFPEYQKELYSAYWHFLEYLAPFIVILSIPYFMLMQRIDNQKDPYWVLGKILCFDARQAIRALEAPKQVLTQHFLKWLVKGFFLPVMFVFLEQNIRLIIENPLHNALTISTFFSFSVVVLFSIDLFIAMLGYIFTLKFFDTHIRSVDATLFGWLVCIICYQPFNATILTLYISWMKSKTSWVAWVKYEPIAYIWCALCLCLLAIYVLATINFGLRFSNLTHRGILTNGPYRYCKHPAYVAKNLFWWLTTVPFLASTPILGIKGALFLSGFSIIYYLRAKTEEKHLSQDPVYVEYALWINQHGLFARLGKILPFLKYSYINNTTGSSTNID